MKPEDQATSNLQELNKRRAAVATIQVAFDFWLPQAERPRAAHAGRWLRLADVPSILSEIERVSQRKAGRSPRDLVFLELQRVASRREGVS